MEEDEVRILQTLDAALREEAVRARIRDIIVRVSAELARREGELMAYESIPLELYRTELPAEVRSSWVFILRRNSTTGAERHPNSRQRMMSYEGSGDFQTREGAEWDSHFLRSDDDAPLDERWVSIPPGVWHQGVVPERDWVVVSFQTAPAHELIEERPDPADANEVRRRTYLDGP